MEKYAVVPPLTAEEKASLIALSSVDGIGRATLWKLLELQTKGELSLGEIWVQNSAFLRKINLEERQIYSVKKFLNEYTIVSYQNWLAEQNIKTVTLFDDQYPALLKESADPPVVLFYKGHEFDNLQLPVAVVGTRNMTRYGELSTKKIVNELTIHGVEVISGVMRGVDSMAHLTALEKGRTIGVLGYGFHHVFPSGQKYLLERIIDGGGTLITEYAPTVNPRAGNFPQRNRIVAGLSLGVLVVEAGQKSGSHITAQCALDNGRSVFAIPGPLTSLYSEGTKWLINQGAVLVTSGDDILKELQFSFQSEEAIQPRFENDLERRVYQELLSQPLELNQLHEFLGIPVSELSATLTLMQLKKLISQSGSMWLVSA